MKKTLLLFFTIFSIGTLSAQEVGVRIGGVNGGGGAAIDAVFGTGSTRIHADLGFFDNGIGVEVLWDLLYKPLGGEAFNWYLGVGPSAIIGDPFRIGVSGEAGLEYRFNGAPIVLGLDWRPTFWIIDDTKFGADSFGLNVRYNFGG